MFNENGNFSFYNLKILQKVFGGYFQKGGILTTPLRLNSGCNCTDREMVFLANKKITLFIVSFTILQRKS